MKTESSKWGLMQLLLKKLTPSKHSLKDLAFLKYIGSSFLINFIRFTYRRTIKKILISGSWDFPMCTVHCCSHGKILILTKILTNMLGEAFFKEKIYLQVIYVNIYTHREYKDFSLWLDYRKFGAKYCYLFFKSGGGCAVALREQRGWRRGLWRG